jgi:hypothetical protein
VPVARSRRRPVGRKFLGGLVDSTERLAIERVAKRQIVRGMHRVPELSYLVALGGDLQADDGRLVMHRGPDQALGGCSMTHLAVQLMLDRVGAPG